jgi:hypothetical protein
MAAQLILSWQVANQTPYQGDTAAFDAVRRGLRTAIQDEEWVQTLSDADKQQMAETLSLGTMLVLGRYGHALETKDAAETQAASQDAIAMVQTYAGVDLRTLQLTPTGFSKR